MSENKKTETKEQRFKRVATRRTQNILKHLRRLGNCSNKNVYKYDDDDISKIFNVVEKEVKRIRALFNNKTEESKFTL